MQMAIPVRTQMIRTSFLGFAAAVGVGCFISCSAVESGPSLVATAPGTHREIPVSSGAELSSSATPTAAASASAKAATDPQDVQAWPCGARPEHIAGAPPPHALSQHVKDRACSEDSECGDGFCDRGHCAPIWEEEYGQRCTMTCQCGSFLCIEGRCRSCLHHKECVENGNTCAAYGLTTTFSLGCGLLGMHETHMPPEPVRPPPPPTP